MIKIEIPLKRAEAERTGCRRQLNEMVKDGIAESDIRYQVMEDTIKQWDYAIRILRFAK